MDSKYIISPLEYVKIESNKIDRDWLVKHTLDENQKMIQGTNDIYSRTKKRKLFRLTAIEQSNKQCY